MTTYVITRDELYRLFDQLLTMYPVMGPRERLNQPGFYYFDWLRGSRDLVLEYITTTIPPKKAFFPPVETMLTFNLGDPPVIKPVFDDRPFVLAGVHPCDLAAIEQLDLAYSYPPADSRWEHSRRRALIVGVDCLPDEYCFCTQIGTATARKPADLFLTKVSGGYLVEVLTPAGDMLLTNIWKTAPEDKDRREADWWRGEKIKQTTARLECTVAEFADILEAGGLTEVWQEVAGRCYSCGSCNTTCPTCFCFDIRDDFDLSLAGGRRKRTWDSCQLLEFALVAGGHNFRGDRWQRVKHRWQRKFLHLYKKFGLPFCTGCGRCSRACTADINIVDVINQLLDYHQERTLHA